MKNLTIRQLLKICQENKFVLLRDLNHQQHGVNCKIALLAAKYPIGLLDQETKFYSWVPCTIHEYISNRMLNMLEDDTSNIPMDDIVNFVANRLNEEMDNRLNEETCTTTSKY